MKKFIVLFCLLLLATGLRAQDPYPPKHWYLSEQATIFNPGTDNEIRNTFPGLVELWYDGSEIVFVDSDKHRYTFVVVSNWYQNEDFIYCWTKEPSSGNRWKILYYPADQTISFLVEDESLFIYYY